MGEETSTSWKSQTMKADGSVEYDLFNGAHSHYRIKIFHHNLEHNGHLHHCKVQDTKATNAEMSCQCWCWDRTDPLPWDERTNGKLLWDGTHLPAGHHGQTEYWEGSHDHSHDHPVLGHTHTHWNTP